MFQTELGIQFPSRKHFQSTRTAQISVGQIPGRQCRSLRGPMDARTAGADLKVSVDVEMRHKRPSHVPSHNPSQRRDIQGSHSNRVLQHDNDIQHASSHDRRNHQTAQSCIDTKACCPCNHPILLDQMGDHQPLNDQHLSPGQRHHKGLMRQRLIEETPRPSTSRPLPANVRPSRSQCIR